MKTNIPKIISGTEYLINHPEVGRCVTLCGLGFSASAALACMVLYDACMREMIRRVAA